MELVGTNTCNHVVGNPEVKYTLNNCPRCLGKGIYGDIVFDTYGKIKTIQGFTQLQQQMQKILLENKRKSGYGFDYTLLKGVVDSSRILAIQRELTRVLTYLIANQQAEKGEGFYYRTSEELKELNSVQVYQDSVEPRKVIALVTVTTVSNVTETASFILRR